MGQAAAFLHPRRFPTRRRFRVLNCQWSRFHRLERPSSGTSPKTNSNSVYQNDAVLSKNSEHAVGEHDADSSRWRACTGLEIKGKRRFFLEFGEQWERFGGYCLIGGFYLLALFSLFLFGASYICYTILCRSEDEGKGIPQVGLSRMILKH